MISLLTGLLIAFGLSVRTPKVDTISVYDWQVSSRIQTKHILIEAERERENAAMYSNGEAKLKFKYSQISVIENTAKKISRQETTVKLPWRKALIQVEGGVSCLWYDFDYHEKLTGYASGSIGNDTVKISATIYPDMDGFESAKVKIESRTPLSKYINLHSFLKYSKSRDKRHSLQGKVELEIKL